MHNQNARKELRTRKGRNFFQEKAYFDYGFGTGRKTESIIKMRGRNYGQERAGISSRKGRILIVDLELE